LIESDINQLMMLVVGILIVQILEVKTE